MNEEQTQAYVRTVSVAVALPLTDAQVQRVAVHLQRTAAMAALLGAVELEVHDEPAEIFCPAPFPRHPA